MTGKHNDEFNVFVHTAGAGGSSVVGAHTRSAAFFSYELGFNDEQIYGAAIRSCSLEIINKSKAELLQVDRVDIINKLSRLVSFDYLHTIARDLVMTCNDEQIKKIFQALPNEVALKISILKARLEKNKSKD